jgi:2-polyprenyl-6-methoxyphenol hydroxylase-like FAD-dependent oxidoreductase
MRILVVGAGIGGLAFLCGLGDTGFEVDLVDQAPAFDPVGVGIVIHPNGIRMLEYLGLAEQLNTEANTISQMEIVRHSSTWMLPLTEIWSRSKYVTVSVLRYKLHSLLARRAMSQERTSVRLRQGCRVVRLESVNFRPIVYFENGERERYDLVVGADGVHSTIRTAILPEAVPISTELLYFRFQAPNVIGLPAQIWKTVELLRPNASFGFIPLKSDLLHCFVQLRTSNYPCFPEDAVKFIHSTVCSWHPTLDKVFSARCGPVHMGFAHTIRPIVWGRGACVLLGDAAHAMSPTLSQGGSLAMEDAVVLALALHQGDSISNAIALYIAARRDRVLWAHRMALAQLNSTKRSISNQYPSTEIAIEYMKHIYEPLCESPISSSKFPLFV